MLSLSFCVASKTRVDLEKTSGKAVSSGAHQLTQQGDLWKPHGETFPGKSPSRCPTSADPPSNVIRWGDNPCLCV